jgi:homoserine kinase
MKQVQVFAPATIANVGPGFDVLGFALESIGDIVKARKIDQKGVRISEIQGDNSRLPKNEHKNTAGIAAGEVLKMIGAKQGVEIKLYKKTPLASGLGSSGASAVAAAYAVNLLFQNKLSKEELIQPCLKAEAAVSGYHADNIAPSLFGGFVLIKSYDPLEIIPLEHIEMYVVAVLPKWKLTTRFARSVIPQNIALNKVVANLGNLSAIIAGIYQRDVRLLGRGIDDRIIEPARARLIPGFHHVKKTALALGAYGCSISGAGPSVFAVTDNQTRAQRIGKAMQQSFAKHNLVSKVYISKIDKKGARQI